MVIFVQSISYICMWGFLTYIMIKAHFQYFLSFSAIYYTIMLKDLVRVKNEYKNGRFNRVFKITANSLYFI